MMANLQQKCHVVSSSIVHGKLLRILVGILLLIAAAFKAHQLLTVPVSGTGILDLYPIRILFIEMELILGGWLICGIRQDIARRIVLCTVVVFAIVALYKAVTGAASCGCFGVLNVNPWYTMFLDVLLIVGLFCWQPSKEETHVIVGVFSVISCPQRIFIFVLAMTSVLFAVAAFPKAPIRELPFAAGASGGSQFVLLEPETWGGQELPVAKYIKGPDLRAGSWLVVFYHNGCGTCQKVVPKFQQIARSWNQAASNRKVAFIDVPDGNEGIEQLVTESPDYASGHFNEAHEWFMATPIALVIDNGLVQRVYSQNALEEKALTIGKLFERWKMNHETDLPE